MFFCPYICYKFTILYLISVRKYTFGRVQFTKGTEGARFSSFYLAPNAFMKVKWGTVYVQVGHIWVPQRLGSACCVRTLI